MPLPARFSQTGLGTTTPWLPDYYKDAPFAIGVGCTVTSTSTGTSYNVEHTFDPIFSGVFPSSVSVIASTSATWFQNTGISGASSNANGNYAFPVTGIRLNVTAGSSTGVITMTLIQAGM